MIVAYNAGNKRVVIIKIASVWFRNKEKMYSLYGQMSMLNAVTVLATIH